MAAIDRDTAEEALDLIEVDWGRAAGGVRRRRGHAGRRPAHPSREGEQRRPHHRRRARRRGRGLQGLGPGDRGHLRERAPVALGHRNHRQRRRLLGQRQVHGLHEHPDAVHGPYAHRLRPGRAGSRRAGHPDGGGRRLRRQVLRRQQRGGERDPGPQGAAPGEDHQHPGRGVPGRQPAPGQHEGLGPHGLQERRPDPRQAHAYHRRQRRLQRQGAGHHRGGGAAARHLLQVLRRPLRGLPGLHQQDPHPAPSAAFGNPSAEFSVEQMDGHRRDELGMDPFEMARLNAAEPDYVSPHGTTS